MKIRSITTLLNPGWPLDENLLEAAGRFNRAAQTVIAETRIEVQTTRLATVPFPQLVPEPDALLARLRVSVFGEGSLPVVAYVCYAIVSVFRHERTVALYVIHD